MTRMTDHTQLTRPRNSVDHCADVIRLDNVKSSYVNWLWNQRLALGKLTLLAGDPGLGKSYLTLDLAARVSTGKSMPGDTWEDGKPMDRFPGYAILLSAEDDPGDTIRPRLEAAGADLRRVSLVAGVRIGSAKKAFQLREHLRFLGDLCKQEPETRLIIIDPISAYLGDEEGHSNTKVRNLLAPLAKMAQHYNVAVVAVTHLNKSGQGNAQSAIYRAMGSLAFTAAARTVHLVTRDPDDPERRLMVPIKNNLGQDRSGYGFTLGPNAEGDTCITWDAYPTRESADALLTRLSRARYNDAAASSKLEEAADWLRDELKNGPVASNELSDAAEARGYSHATLKRARQAVGAEAVKQDNIWSVQLPCDPPTLYAG